MEDFDSERWQGIRKSYAGVSVKDSGMANGQFALNFLGKISADGDF
jgi:hypothetical protein